MPVPVNPWLVGRKTYFQWVYVDPGAAPFPVFSSDALEIAIGK